MADQDRAARIARIQKIERIKALEGQEPATAAAPKEDEGIVDSLKAGGMKALELAGRTLDYPAGLARVAATGLTDIPYSIRTGKSVSRSDDALRALKGDAPTSEEYLERQGMEPGMERTALGIVKDIALDPLTYMTGGASAVGKVQKVKSLGKWGELGEKLNQLTRGAGEKIYKSGLKGVDLEVAKYGKEPVSDVLMREGFTGSAEQAQKRMDELAEVYKRERDYILKKATRAGGEVNMREAMAPLMAKIQELKNVDDPNTIRLAKIMEKDASQYLSRGAREPEQFLRELPVQGNILAEAEAQEIGKFTNPERKFVDLQPGADVVKGQTKIATDGGVALDANLLPMREADQVVSRPAVRGSYVEPGGFEPGKRITVPEKFVPNKAETVLDTTERVSGPTPIQANKWKSSQYNIVGSPAYERAAQTPIGKDLAKTKARGLKEAVESAVETATGKQNANELRELNDKLGRILTSKKKAAMEAAKEIKKNTFSSVDGMIVGLGGENSIKGLAIKKAADIAKMTGPRTKAGKFLMDRANTNMLLEKNLLYSPWPTLGRQTRGDEK